MNNWIGLMLFGATSTVAFAQGGQQGGNGGNAIVCYADRLHQQVVSVEMFDYWEKNRAHPIAGGVQLGPDSASVEEKIDIALDRVRRLDPLRADRYQKTAHEILAYLPDYLSDQVSPIPIEDDHPEARPEEPCVKVQFAIQLTHPQAGKRRFQINEKLWNSEKTPNDARAGLILHEAIYREALNLGQTNSDQVRTYNYLISTMALERPQIETEYQKVLKTLGFPAIGVCALLYVQNIRQFIALYTDESGKIGNYLCPGRSIVTERATFSPVNKSVFYASDDGSTVFRNTPFTIKYLDGTISSTAGEYLRVVLDEHANPVEIQTWNQYTGNAPHVTANGTTVRCNEDLELTKEGRIKRCSFDGNPRVKSNDGGKELTIDNFIEVDPEGKLVWVGFDPPQLYKLEGVKEAKPLDSVNFDSSGKVIGGLLDWPSRSIFDFKGFKVSANWIHLQKGEWWGRATYSDNAYVARYHGVEILRPTNRTPEAQERLDKIIDGTCVKLGFDDFYSSSASEQGSVKRHVGGYTEFYDAMTDKIVGVFDDDVTLLGLSLYCFVQTKVPL